jgi:chromosome segregation ATPase
MNLETYIAAGLAALALLALLRVLWSTSGRQLAKYRVLIAEGIRSQEKLQKDVQLLEEARDLLRKANGELQRAIKAKDAEIVSQTHEIKALKMKLDNQLSANQVLNDTIGLQDIKIKELSRDVESLKDQVLTLRAQMGMEL